MSFWLPLKRGETVDIVAPSAAFKKAELQNGVNWLKKLGFIPRYHPQILKKDFIFSQTEENRAKQLIAALKAKDSRFIFCVRGGSGSMRLLPYLSKVKAPENKKILIGLSDVCAIHWFLNQKWKWPSLHAPVLARLGGSNASSTEKIEFLEVLMGKRTELEYPKLKPLNASAIKCQTLKAQVVGGNLLTLEALLGTPWSFKGKGKIVLFEEINERGYRIDRMLDHMEFSGALEGVKAVILGDFLGGLEPDGKSFVKAAILRFAERSKFPVFSGIETGHGSLQRVVPLLTSAKISKNAGKFQMVVETGCRK